MHPTTYEALAKSHIRDLQPGRTWPTTSVAEGGSTGWLSWARIKPIAAWAVATVGRWVRRPVSA